MTWLMIPLITLMVRQIKVTRSVWIAAVMAGQQVPFRQPIRRGTCQWLHRMRLQHRSTRELWTCRVHGHERSPAIAPRQLCLLTAGEASTPSWASSAPMALYKGSLLFLTKRWMIEPIFHKVATIFRPKDEWLSQFYNKKIGFGTGNVFKIVLFCTKYAFVSILGSVSMWKRWWIKIWYFLPCFFSFENFFFVFFFWILQQGKELQSVFARWQTDGVDWHQEVLFDPLPECKVIEDPSHAQDWRAIVDSEVPCVAPYETWHTLCIF